MAFFPSFRQWFRRAKQAPIQTRIKTLHKKKSEKLQRTQLEDRLAPATTPTFVNDNWNLIADNGAVGVLDAGDQVRNDNDTINPGTIVAILGTDGFGTVTTGAVTGTVAGAAT